MAALQEWHVNGLCSYYGSDLFFPADVESRGSRLRRESRAKAICESCPVKRQCRNHALDLPEEWGIWGGTSEVDRRRGRHRTVNNAQRQAVSRSATVATGSPGGLSPNNSTRQRSRPIPAVSA